LGTDIHYVRATDGVRDMARGRGMEVILGRGSADFPALLAALGERSYSGYLCVERETSSDPQADLQQALEFLRNL
jgi:sugar phosphate isomerase/epimerase